jgi:hypothetical protein
MAERSLLMVPNERLQEWKVNPDQKSHALDQMIEGSTYRELTQLAAHMFVEL